MKGEMPGYQLALPVEGKKGLLPFCTNILGPK